LIALGPFGWLLQWSIRVLVLLIVAALPIGVDMANFSTALLSAVVIGLLGIVLIAPLKLLLGPLWAITYLGGLISPVSFIFNWLITIILFGLAAWLVDGFGLKKEWVTERHLRHSCIQPDQCDVFASARPG